VDRPGHQPATANLLHPFAAAKPATGHFSKKVTIGIFSMQTGFKYNEVEMKG